MLLLKFMTRMLLTAVLLVFLLPRSEAQTAALPPDQLIKQASTELIDAAKADKSLAAGDLPKLIALVDSKVMPYVNFQRMTSSAMGRHWRTATPEQQKRLQEEFKVLLVRTYAGALAQLKDRDVQINLKPMRAAAEDTEVLVRTDVKGGKEPIQMDYRLEKTDAGWKIYDVNVLGIWLVEQYRNNFNTEINAGGIDALIAKLVEKNKSSAAASAPKS